MILSGYKEFDYVRRAFSNHVTDYILKPLNDNELKMLLCRIRKIIQKKRFEEHAQDFELALSGKERKSEGKSEEQCLLLITVGNGKDGFIETEVGLYENLSGNASGTHHGTVGSIRCITGSWMGGTAARRLFL